jgi:serine/threonine protein kinase
LDDFILVKTVGKGSFGKVVMVRKKDDSKIYAMKILKKEMVLKRKQYEHTLAERRILENIDHPFIVSLRFAFQTEHKLYMVFDFFNGGELYHYLSEGGRFTEDRARFYAAEIASALDYLHRHGVVYRDLKPENLILDAAGHIRITDFGCVARETDPLDHACCSGAALRGLVSCDAARLLCGADGARFVDCCGTVSMTLMPAVAGCAACDVQAVGSRMSVTLCSRGCRRRIVPAIRRGSRRCVC